jgi:glycosyltransferase involved in cell wall biosynthesis
MKIAFLLGSPEISGGTYVIYEHATRLRHLGHELSIITSEKVAAHQYSWHSSAGDLRWLDYEQAKQEHFDILLATWWQSPFLLKDFSAVHYVYFVQSIETRFFEPPDPEDYGAQDHDIWQELCEKTYSFALPMITEARWIQDYLYEHYNTNAFLVRNGIRKDIYTVSGSMISPAKEGFLRVLVEGPVDVPYKNVPTSIELARQAGADEVWLLTSSDVSEFSGVDRVFSRVSILETPAIYRSCDVLLKLSYVEGMFGPPLEIFHCGGTAIVYKVTGHDEYIVHDQNSLVADRDDREAVVRYLQLLKADPATLARLKEGALRTAGNWPDWEHCTHDFEKALQSIALDPPTSRKYLDRYTREIFDSAKPKGKAKILNSFLEREENYTKNEPASKHNFAEFYWHCTEKFTSRDFKWKYYRSEEWQDITFEVEVTGFPFWMRIDPSIRVGIVSVAEIRVTNIRTRAEIMSFVEPDDFGVLFLCGTVCWLDETRKNILFSYGGDPMLVLPAVNEDTASLGDSLKVEIKLRETCIQQFFKELYMNQIVEQPVVHEKSAPHSLKRKIINKLTGGSKMG